MGKLLAVTIKKNGGILNFRFFSSHEFVYLLYSTLIVDATCNIHRNWFYTLLTYILIRTFNNLCTTLILIIPSFRVPLDSEPEKISSSVCQRRIPCRLPLFQTAPLNSLTYNARPRSLCISNLLPSPQLDLPLSPRFYSFVLLSTSYATLNAGSLYSGSGRARKDRDRLENFRVVVWDGVSTPHYAATCTADQRELKERKVHLLDKWLASPCCVPPHGNLIVRETSTAI